MNSGFSNSRNPNKKSYRLTDDLAHELDLNEGQVVRAVVVSCLEDSTPKILLNIKGKQVIAQTKLDVSQSQDLIVKVKSIDKPIELKIFEQENATKQLSSEELSQYVENMGIQSSEELMDLLPELASQHLPLSEEILQSAQEYSDLITNDFGGIDEDRSEAFTFLHKNDVSVSEEAIEIVAQSSSSNMLGWPGRSGGNLKLHSEQSLKDLIQKTGIDYVNQIGRWPETARKTLHGQLLGEFKNKKDDMDKEGKKLLASLLKLGILNTKSKEETVLPMPVPGKELFGYGKISISKLNEEPNNWELSAIFRLRNHEVGIEVSGRGKNLVVEFTSEKKRLLEFLEESVFLLKQELKKKNFNTEVKFKAETPEIEEFSFEHSQSEVEIPRGVDLTI